jgi:outer membrane scaffolding protein for murein synthesis (MipA/OmpV family)
MGGWDFIATPERSLGVGVQLEGDVANGHGYLISPYLSGRQRLMAGLTVAGNLSTTWASESYMSDYFGVDSADARRSGLDRHNADAGIKDVSLGLSLGYDITPNWQVSLLGRYARLLGDAADSPIVDDVGSKNQFFGGLLAAYRF